MRVLAVFTCSLALLLLGLDRDAKNLFDEGQILVGAKEVYWGAVPYRDFWTAYGPGQYWAIAGLFKLFGPYLLVERIWDATLRAAFASLAYLMTRELVGPRIALFTWMGSLGWLWMIGYSGYPLVAAGFLGTLSAHLLILYVRGSVGSWGLVSAGAVAGLASLFRHDIGVYVVAAEIAAMAYERYGTRAAATIADRRRTAVLPEIGLLIAGALSTTAPVALLLIYSMPLSDLLHPFVVYPLKIYVPTRHLPFPSLTHALAAVWSGEAPGVSLTALSGVVALYFPWLMAGLGITLFWNRSKIFASSLGDPTTRFAGFLLALLTLAFSLKTLVRPHTVHLAHVLVASLILAGMFFAASRAARSTLATAAIVAVSALMAYAPLYSVNAVIGQPGALSMLTTAIRDPTSSAAKAYAYLSRRENGPAAAAYFAIDPDQAAAVSFIQTNTSRDDALFVGNSRHDLILVNDVLFYFLAERRPATKFYEFDPGVTTEAPIQAAIIDDIRKACVPYVVIVRLSRYEAVREPNKSAESSGETALDEFLRNDFRLVARFGGYEIRKRPDVDLALPRAPACAQARG